MKTQILLETAAELAALGKGGFVPGIEMTGKPMLTILTDGHGNPIGFTVDSSYGNANVVVSEQVTIDLLLSELANLHGFNTRIETANLAEDD